jgi:superfamily I DNA/RNA helicase
MTYVLLPSQVYKDDIDHLPREVRENALPKMQRLLEENPKHPGLFTEDFKGINKRQVFRSRVNLHYRIAWWYESDGAIALWRVGPHEMIDSLTGTTSFPAIERFVEVKTPQQETKSYDFSQSIKRKAIFGNFPPAHLRMLGVPENLIQTLLKIEDFEEIYNIALPDYALQILAGVYTNPNWSIEDLADTRYIFYRASADQLEEYCKGKVKQLMLDLAPEQKRLVEYKTTGPTLIKGVAGSGKTTIGVYRAIEHAKQKGLFGKETILFLTYTETLKRVVEQLFEELLGQDNPNGNEKTYVVSTVRDWAENYLLGKTDRKRVNGDEDEKLLTRAFEAVRRKLPYNPMVRRKINFFVDEISQVIKGRGVENWEEYKTLSRHGRVKSLQEGSRQFVWEVYLEYQKLLQSAKLLDYDDITREALKHLKQSPALNLYREVIVDEAQDLFPIDLQLITEIAGGKNATGLLLLADPKQSIYYKGIPWKDGGVEIEGRRVHKLEKNFRNTRQILNAAWSLVSQDVDAYTADELIPPSVSEKQGRTPELVRCLAMDQEITFVIETILEIFEKQMYRPGDIAILTRLTDAVDKIKNRLESRNIPCVHFRDNHFQIFENEVKVITINSAKGLEFPVVFLADLNEGSLPRDLLREDPEDMEVNLRKERQILYVGMTRASERLYMTCTRATRSRFLNDVNSEFIRASEYQVALVS